MGEVRKRREGGRDRTKDGKEGRQGGIRRVRRGEREREEEKERNTQTDKDRDRQRDKQTERD